MNKKLVSFIAMIVSLALVFVGFLALVGALGGKTNYASSSGYQYDSGYAEFGADFYTYVSNNAAEAASATRTIASNQRAIAKLVKNIAGFCMMGAGLLSLCHFTLVWLDEKKKATVAPQVVVSTPAPVAEETPKSEE